MINRLFAFVVRLVHERSYPDTETVERRQPSCKSLFSGIQRWTKQYIILPGTFGYRHQEPLGWCTIPTRVQSLIIVGFVGLNIILSSIRYTSFLQNILYVYALLSLKYAGGGIKLRGMTSWSRENEQILAYVTGRTGFLAVANLPLLWIFAGRNDIFLWLTGWNFGTFNIFHRYVARVVAIEAIIHSIGSTYLVYMG